eukprot:gene28275-31379_t
MQLGSILEPEEPAPSEPSSGPPHYHDEGNLSPRAYGTAASAAMQDGQPTLQRSASFPKLSRGSEGRSRRDRPLKAVPACTKVDPSLMLLDPKRAKRILANRESAAKSKDRKQKYTSQLQDESSTYEAELAGHRNRAVEIREQNCVLEHYASEMAARAAELQRLIQTADEDNASLKAKLFAMQTALGMAKKLPFVAHETPHKPLVAIPEPPLSHLYNPDSSPLATQAATVPPDSMADPDRQAPQAQAIVGLDLGEGPASMGAFAANQSGPPTFGVVNNMIGTPPQKNPMLNPFSQVKSVPGACQPHFQPHFSASKPPKPWGASPPMSTLPMQPTSMGMQGQQLASVGMQSMKLQNMQPAHSMGMGNYGTTPGLSSPPPIPGSYETSTGLSPPPALQGRPSPGGREPPPYLPMAGGQQMDTGPAPMDGDHLINPLIPDSYINYRDPMSNMFMDHELNLATNDMDLFMP